MKKRLTALFLAVLVVVAIPVTAEAASTYRGQLNSIEREIYDAMASYLPYGYDSFSYELSQSQVYSSAEEANAGMQWLVARAYEAFYRDHPEVVWLDKQGFSFSSQYYMEGEMIHIVGFSLRASFTTSSYQSQKSALEGAVSTIVQNATGTDYDKVRYFHDEILARCTYNTSAVSYYDPVSCEAYGALVLGSAICEGYAKAFKLLCDRSGIPCEIVGGTVDGEAHMWNYVQLGGSYYLVDVTFDDAPGETGYNYFLRGAASVTDHLESGGLLEGYSTGFSYPSLSWNDYVPGEDDGNAVAPIIGGGSELASEEAVQPESSVERHPAVIPETEEGFCRVSCLFSKNGRFWVRKDGAGFSQGSQAIEEGTGLQILAFPEPGYRVEEIVVTGKDGEIVSAQNRCSLSFSLEKDCQIQVIFQKIAA